MISPPVRTLIVDDEPPARGVLRDLIRDTACLELVGEAATGDEASTMVESLRPELMLLDVQLPGTSGMDVLAGATHQPVVIFTTAFDSYALRAFELGAVDYLTKPFGVDRFRRALDRSIPQIEWARDRAAVTTAAPQPVSPAHRLREVGSGSGPLETLYVRSRGAVVPVATNRITHLEASGDYVVVHSPARHDLVYLNLRDLAQQLDGQRFIRIHRSHVVNLDHVGGISAVDPNRVEVILRNGTRIVASRAGTRLLRERMRNPLPK